MHMADDRWKGNSEGDRERVLLGEDGLERATGKVPRDLQPGGTRSATTPSRSALTDRDGSAWSGKTCEGEAAIVTSPRDKIACQLR